MTERSPEIYNPDDHIHTVTQVAYVWYIRCDI